MGLTNGHYSWRSKYGNLTFKDLQHKIFHYDYNKSSTNNSELKFLMPYGFCLKFNKTVIKKTRLFSDKKSIFMLTDPQKINNLRTNEMENSRIKYGPTTNNLFDMAAYEIQYSLYDSRIHDGKTCTDYTRIKSSYEDCILSVLKARLLKYYKCLPPWFPKQFGQTCEVDKEIEVQHENPGHLLEYSDEKIMYDMNELIFGRELKMLKDCLQPCLSQDVKIVLATHRYINYHNIIFV